MQTLQTLLLVVQVLVAVGLIALILLQHGKGADAGAAFGSGASSTVFGARGSGNFLTRATSVLAFIFLLNSLSLAYIATQRVGQSESLMQEQTSDSLMQQQAPAESGRSQQEKSGSGPDDSGSEIPPIPE